MPFLLTMSLFGSVGTLIYIILLPLFKKYFSPYWRRAYLICNILEYLIPFPYYHVIYKELLASVSEKAESQISVKTPLYLDITTDTIQISGYHFYVRDYMIYIMIGIIIAGLLLFFYQMNQYRRLKCLLRDHMKEITDQERRRMIQTCTSKDIIARHIRIYQCDALSTPITVGIFKPVIILPGMNWTRQELSLIIEHEVAHVKHLDNFIKMLVLVVLVLNFYNPLAYYLLFQWNFVAELSCDRKVITGKSSKVATKYGILILTLATERDVVRVLPVAGLNLQNKMMKERIYQLKKGVQKEKLFKKLAGIGIMSSTLFLSSLTVLAYQPKNVAYGDAIADEIFLADMDVEPWGSVYGDIPVSENGGWALFSEDGDIIEILGDIEHQAEVHSACSHSYTACQASKHYKNSDGSCKVEVYSAQRCSKCGNVTFGELINTITFAKCLH